MKKNISLLLCLLLSFILIMPNVYADKDCSSYSTEDTCPYLGCTWSGGICTQGNIGDNFCSTEEVQNVMYVLGVFIWIAKIFVPLLIIGFGTFDLMKGVTGGDEKAIKDGAKRFGIRFLIGFIIFFIPTLLDALLTGISNFDAISEDYMVCEKCLLKPNECGEADTEEEITDDERCSSVSNQSACGQTSGCTWSNDDNACHSSSYVSDPVRCSSVNNQSACNNVSGCYWSNDSNTCKAE